MNDAELNNFKTLAAEAINYNDSSIAARLLGALRREINLTPELQELKTKLQWVRFSSLQDEEVFQLLQLHLEMALQLPDYDVADKIGHRIVYAELPDAQVAFMQGALDALSKNVELIGDKTTRDLITSYYNFRASSAKRSSLDEINFVNQSADTKIFSDEQKALLLAILKITDSLRNGLQEIQAPVTDPSEEEFPPNFDFSVLVPGVIRDEVPSTLDRILGQRTPAKATTPANTVASIDASTGPVPVLRTMRANAVPGRPAPQPPAVPKPAVPSALTSVRRPPGATVNMQDILNRQGQRSGGVVFDEQTNIKVEEMSQRIEAERQQRQNQIDKKLEALKKRGTK